MAISGVTLRGEIGGRGGLTLAVSPLAAITVGKIAFAACVADNSGTTDGATTFHTLTDTDGHTWTRLWEETETDGAASDGVSQSLWATVVTSEIGTGDSVTFGSPDAGAANARVLALFEATFSGGAGFALENKALARGTESVTLGSLPSREYLFIHFSGAEGEDNAATADADYTALTTLRSGTTGASDTNVCMHLAVRVATLTGDTAASTLFTSVTNLLTSLTAVYEPAGGPTTHEGTGSSSVVVTTSATGEPTHKATGSSSVVVTASATGEATHFATGSSNVVVSVTASGTPTHKATGSSSVVVTATATGLHTGVRTGSSNVVVTTTGAGNVQGVNEGTGSSSIVVSTTATGKPTHKATGSCSVVVSTSATGKRRAHRTGSSSIVVTCTATGSVGARQGQGSALIVVSATGAGESDATTIPVWPVSTPGVGWPVSTNPEWEVVS